MSRVWKQGLLSLPGIGLSALPKLACPLLLACVCRLAEFSWSWFSRISCLPIAAHHRIPSPCAGGSCIQGEKPPRIGSVSNWIDCGNERFAR